MDGGVAPKEAPAASSHGPSEKAPLRRQYNAPGDRGSIGLHAKGVTVRGDRYPDAPSAGRTARRLQRCLGASRRTTARAIVSRRKGHVGDGEDAAAEWLSTLPPGYRPEESASISILPVPRRPADDHGPDTLGGRTSTNGVAPRHMRSIVRRLYDPVYRYWFRVEWEGLERSPARVAPF